MKESQIGIGIGRKHWNKGLNVLQPESLKPICLSKFARQEFFR